MAYFILMHGAWHWGGCFQKVADELLVLGHKVATPDLATYGYDATPPEAVTDMAGYTAPVRRLIEASDEKIILLGHSLGGISCTYLGEQLPDKITTLVYLAAFMHAEGKATGDYTGLSCYAGNPSAAEFFQVLQPGPGGLVLDMSKPDLVKRAFYDDCSDHDIAIALKNNRASQIIPPAVAPAQMTANAFGKLPRVYIECTQDRALPIEAQRYMQAGLPGAEVVTMNTSHSPFFSAPEKLAAILAGLV